MRSSDFEINQAMIAARQMATRLGATQAQQEEVAAGLVWEKLRLEAIRKAEEELKQKEAQKAKEKMNVQKQHPK